MGKIGTYQVNPNEVDDAPIPVTGAVTVAPTVYADPTRAAGSATALAANTVVTGADTGNLAAGNYRIEATLGYSGVSAAGKHIVLERRNAADSATQELLALCPAGGAMGVVLERVAVSADESIRVATGAVASAASEVTQGMIRAYLL